MLNVSLPHLGEGIDQVELAIWHVSEGDSVDEGQDICEVTTDKASFNVIAPARGTMKTLLMKEGQMVKEGELIAVIELSV